LSAAGPLTQTVRRLLAKGVKMEKKFSDEKAVELIFEYLQKLKRGETSFEAFAVGVALVIDPVPPTEEDFEWARETARSLGLGSLLTPRVADREPPSPLSTYSWHCSACGAWHDQKDFTCPKAAKVCR
jgi:hypothetical protein